MEPLARKARMAIASDLDLATSVSRLSERIRREETGTSAGAGVEGDPELIRELSRHPSLFRIVDPWRGPWRAVPGPGWADRTRTPVRQRDDVYTVAEGSRAAGVPSAIMSGQMVVPVDVDWADGEACLARRLRESVYRIGRSVDEHSPVSIARWARMVGAAAAAQRRLRQ